MWIGKECAKDATSTGVHMKVVDILIKALKGIAVNSTECKACKMCAYTAQEALDKYYGKDRTKDTFRL